MTIDRLLHKPVDPAELHKNTVKAAEPATSREENTESITIFRIGQEFFGLTNQMIARIVDARPLQAIPHRNSVSSPKLFNYDGTIITCFVLSEILQVNHDSDNSKSTQRVIVLAYDTSLTSFLVDQVCFVHRYAATGVAELPVTNIKQKEQLFSGLLQVEDKAVALISPEMFKHKLNGAFL